MKYKILITDPISESGISILKDNNCEIIDKIESKDSIHEIIDKIDGWIIRSGTKISETDIKAAENLKVIGRAGVGVDNIDIKTATKYGIVVMNVPDGNSISAAEHTMAMILTLSRNIHLGHASLEDGTWERANLIGNELKNKGDEQLRILSENGVRGIHLCGEDDLTEILSFCFSGFEIELLSVIREKDLLENLEQNRNSALPELKSGELILLASLEHRASLTELLVQQGFQKYRHWILFS